MRARTMPAYFTSPLSRAERVRVRWGLHVTEHAKFRSRCPVEWWSRNFQGVEPHLTPALSGLKGGEGVCASG